MKSWNHLFPEIASLENLYAAVAKARKRKTLKGYVEDFGLRCEREIRQLQEGLWSDTYRPGAYRQFRIYDPRERLISAAPFRDRVIHHALCNVIEPVIQRRFVFDSYSCQKGKGTGLGRERARQFTNRYRFVLKADIRKYFQSIDHQILKAKLGRVIRCERTLRLCELIIDSSCDTEVAPGYFPGDDLFGPHERKRGLPIGNLTSQLWANFYLDELDHLVKEDLRAPGYGRYTDDFLIWSDDKDYLRDCQLLVADHLARDRLILHPTKTRVQTCANGVPFLGFRFSPGAAPRVLSPVKRRFEKRMRRQFTDYRRGNLTREAINLSARGWVHFAEYGNVRGLIKHYRKGGFAG